MQWYPIISISLLYDVSELDYFNVFGYKGSFFHGLSLEATLLVRYDRV